MLFSSPGADINVMFTVRMETKTNALAVWGNEYPQTRPVFLFSSEDTSARLLINEYFGCSAAAIMMRAVGVNTLRLKKALVSVASIGSRCTKQPSAVQGSTKTSVEK